jgi:hypothetical protein
MALMVDAAPQVFHHDGPVGCTLLSSIFIGPAGEQGRVGDSSVAEGSQT